MTAQPPVLAIEGLTTQISTHGGVITPVDHVDLTISAGETVCVVGESGSGKSLVALSIMRVLPAGARTVSGRILFDGLDVLTLDEKRMRDVRGGGIAMVLQDPMTAFNPLLTVGAQITEAIKAHASTTDADAKQRCLALLTQVRMPDPEQTARSLPGQLSGGMSQRALIAMALATDPLVVLADEPTTALDVTVQAQVLELLRELKVERGLALLLITHDMGVAAMVADRIVVMYAGRVVETGPVGAIFREPRHPYTKGLINSARDEGGRGRSHASIPGMPPDLHQLPAGCSFAPRCSLARSACRDGRPPLRQLGDGLAACILEDHERPWLQTAGVAHA